MFGIFKRSSGRNSGGYQTVGYGRNGPRGIEPSVRFSDKLRNDPKRRRK